MRRALYWLGVLAGVGLLAAGAVIGISGYAATGAPDAPVRSYFAALARGDAPGALAYGDVPAGPRTLLTGPVLAEQLRIAPLRDVRLGTTTRQGTRAEVAVSYTLAFPDKAVPVHASVPVHRSGDHWRLDAAAVSTRLAVHGAAQRMTLVGARPPDVPTLLFPGALPIRFDTPNLQLDPSAVAVGFGAKAVTDVVVQPSAKGRAAMIAAARDALAGCLTSAGTADCPLPDGRYVPGSVRGTVQGTLRNATVNLDQDDAAGVLTLDARATLQASYRQLDFHNVAVAEHGRLDLPIHARAYAVSPQRLHWTAS